MITLKEQYKTALPELAKILGEKNRYALPRLAKVAINAGTGKLREKKQAYPDKLKSRQNRRLKTK
mgnify:CR=1 FL=1